MRRKVANFCPFLGKFDQHNESWMGGFDPNDSTTWGFTGTFLQTGRNSRNTPKYPKMEKKHAITLVFRHGYPAARL